MENAVRMPITSVKVKSSKKPVNGKGVQFSKDIGCSLTKT